MPNTTLRRVFAILLSATTLHQNTVTAFTYRWPSPQHERLEELLYTNTFSSAVDGCERRTPIANSSTQAAEWLRFAYHDMSTHNVDDGTGGLDGSIHFELDRDETNYQPCLIFLLLADADIVALGAIHGVAACNGPLIPFKGGRIDAAGLGPEGVPKPEQLIKDHIEKFRKQGFNQTDMIALVACGHTLGSVRSDDFPDIVPGPPKQEQRGTVSFFDEPADAPPDGREAFDESVVTRYLNSTTTNPLVVTNNVTMRSDFRVFSSDGNVTMRSISSAAAFRDRCKSVLERMVNTVPNSVKLSDPIELIEEKVQATGLYIAEGDPLLYFVTGLRLSWKDGSTPPANRTTRVCWCDKYGPDKACARKTARCAKGTDQSDRVTPSSYSKQQGIKMSFTTFRAAVDSAQSVSQFWFEINDGANAKWRKVVNTDGKNFEFGQDDVIWRPRTVDVSKPGDKNHTFDFQHLVGVRHSESYPHPTLTLRLFQRTPFKTQDDKYPLSLNTSIPAVAGYDFYTAATHTPREDLADPAFDVLGELGPTENGPGNGKHDIPLLEDQPPRTRANGVGPATQVEIVKLDSSS